MPTPSRVVRTVSLLAALAVGGQFATPAMAQEPYDAVVETRALAAIRAGDVRVDYRENTELNSRLAREIESALTQRGFVLRERPSMLLDLRTAVRRPEEGGVRLRLYGEGGNRAGLDDFRVGVDLPDPEADTRTVHYEVYLDLIDREARRIVWTGKATADLRGQDRFQVTSALGRRLVDLIGQSKPAR